MAPGRFVIEPFEDFVYVQEEGSWDARVADAFVAEATRVTLALAAQYGSSVHLADVRGITDISLVARIKCEMWAAGMGAKIRFAAIVTDDAIMRGMLELSSRFAPSLKFRLVSSVEEGLKLLGREAYAEAVAQVRRDPSWHGSEQRRTGST